MNTLSRARFYFVSIYEFVVTTICLVVSENDIMVAGIRGLLAKYTDVMVRPIGAFVDGELARTIEMLNPDVLILDEGLHTTPPAQLQKLLVNLPSLRVFVVNVKDNVLRIYQGDWFEEAHTQNLGMLVYDQGPH